MLTRLVAGVLLTSETRREIHKPASSLELYYVFKMRYSLYREQEEVISMFTGSLLQYSSQG
jgi:hypothetical protein